MRNAVQVSRALNGLTIIGTAAGGSVNVIAGALSRMTSASYGDCLTLIAAKIDGGEIDYRGPYEGADISDQWSEITASSDAAIAAMRTA